MDTPVENKSPLQEQAPACADADEMVYLLDSDFIGSNMELGKVLINGFMQAAATLEHKRCTVVLVSNAVRLVTKNSYALDVFEKLARKGYRILICGTCLDYFKLRDDVAVGTVSNALEIMQTMSAAEKVVKF